METDVPDDILGTSLRRVSRYRLQITAKPAASMAMQASASGASRRRLKRAESAQSSFVAN
jgi:hypothetical protein